jgi:hypothetical protein
VTILVRAMIGGVMIAVLFVAGVAAQQGRFRSGIDLVNLGVMVLDKRGNLITDLTATDFEVYEDGQRQDVRFFARGDAEIEAQNLRLGLLFDTSGSMTDDIRLARTAAVRFLNTLHEAQDITLVDFDTEVRVARYGQNDFPGWSNASASGSRTGGRRSTMPSRSISTVCTTSTAARFSWSHQVLLGVTGSGKTFTMAQVIARVNRPAAGHGPQQDARRAALPGVPRFFPDNAVEYFVSYYDYYQPEAYVPASDSYIEKEATINDEIDRMRLSATRRSSSGATSSSSPASRASTASARRRRTTGWCCRSSGASASARRDPAQAGRDPVRAQRLEFGRGTFRVRGDIVEVFPSYEEQAVRIELFGDEIDELATFDPLTGKTSPAARPVAIYPKSHFVTSRERTRQAVESIKAELSSDARRSSSSEGKLLEAQRLHQRTMFDLEMIREIGYCHGIENYARHLTGPAPGEPPPTLLDYLPRGRAGLRRREPPDGAAGARHVPRRPLAQGRCSSSLRLPPAVGARQPAAELRRVGGARRAGRLVSATPGPYELRRRAAWSSSRSSGRPGLMDPEIEVRPVRARSTTCWPRSASARRAASGCS